MSAATRKVRRRRLKHSFVPTIEASDRKGVTLELTNGNEAVKFELGWWQYAKLRESMRTAGAAQAASLRNEAARIEQDAGVAS